MKTRHCPPQFFRFGDVRVPPNPGFMSSSLDSVGKVIMFSAVRRPRSFVRSFVRTDIVTTISHERLEQSR